MTIVLAAQADHPGYEVQHDVLSAQECDALLAALTGISSKARRAGSRHLMSNSVVAGLAADRRLLAIAKSVLGSTATPFRATLFEKSGHRNWLVPWHQDTALPLASPFDAAGWGPWSRKGGVLYAHAPTWALSRVVALRVHLDASTNENGPLRVIPGSHQLGVLADRAVIAHARTHPRMECTVSRGGVLAMRPLLIHASSKARNTNPRRVLHIEYADALDLGVGVRLAIT